MERFTTLNGVAAALPLINIDTDMLVPKQHLKTIARTGLGRVLFEEMRYDADGAEIPDFVLNRPPWRAAKILVAGDNFGCGSSREHAPWALLDFGIRCVIAPSFADIFFNNCFKNGILPLAMKQEIVDELELLARNPETADMTVDLQEQIIRAGNQQWSFEIEPFRRKCLLEGLDDIGLTLQHADKIDAYEAGQKQKMPWLWERG